MDLILADMEKYKTTNSDFHSGDVIQHSIWSALYMNLFKIQSGIVKDIPKKYRYLMVVAAVLHDIGKCGDNVFTFFDKPAHPEIGGYYFEKGKYINIDLKQVIEEYDLKNHYTTIYFLVRWHWMIGGIIKDFESKNDSTKASMIY